MQRNTQLSSELQEGETGKQVRNRKGEGREGTKKERGKVGYIARGQV